MSRAWNKMIVRTTALAAVAVSSLGMTGCQAVQSNGVTAAQLRVIDASVDAGGLDIYSNNSAIIYNIGFATISSYIPMSPGSYTLAAKYTGTTTTATSAKQTLVTAKQYTAIISNTTTGMATTVLTDASSPAPSGQINLRFIDQASKIGGVDIYVVPSGYTIDQVSALQTNLTLGSNTGYLNVPVGTYTLYVYPTGTVISTTATSYYTGTAVSYPTGCARTIVLIDQQVITQPGVNVVTANDYDSATATN